ncbi:cytochrome c oxidase subunit 3 [Saprospiraceae bacterium]|nr:cytochrome c oxidase subunit 3 [Saprospiraceae bacterium]
MTLGYKQTRLLMQFFLASEAMFFVVLIIAYVYYRNYSNTWVDSTEYLDVMKSGFYTALLLASSGTIAISAKGVHNKNRSRIILGLVLTIALGIIFLVGQGMEYAGLVSSDMTMSENIFGSAFFTLTGFHGLHVLIGVIAMSIILWLTYKGHINESQSSAFLGVEWYWHFVDVVWVIVFFVVYIIPLL